MAAKKFDEQKIFNKVAKHLLKQNAKCASPRGTCYYRGAGGMSCAIGCLIPDTLYTPDIENRGIHALYGWGDSNTCEIVRMREGSKKKKLFNILNGATGAATADDLRFLSKMQSTHDNCAVEDWRRALRDVADEYNLKVPAYV